MPWLCGCFTHDCVKAAAVSCKNGNGIGGYAPLRRRACAFQ